MTDLDKIDQIIEGLKLASDWEYNGSNFGDMPKKALTTPQARQAIADLLVEARLAEVERAHRGTLGEYGHSIQDQIYYRDRAEELRVKLKKGIK